MAGLKETQFRYEPKSFHTFDLDRIGDNRSEIYDEMGDVNPMIRLGDAIHLEQLSLNDLELSDQFSGALNKNQKSDGNGNWDNNSGFSIIDSADYSFPNGGAFSIEFLYYKQRPGEIRNNGEPGYNSDITSPIICKGSMINVYIKDYYYNNSNEGMNVQINGNAQSVNVLQTEYPVYNRINHVIITYETVPTDINQWDAILKIYMNGRLFGTSTKQYVDNIPITDVPDAWYVGKNPTGNDPRYDWNTERLSLDQLAIYDYAFNEEQVIHHYRKTKRYLDLIRDDYPSHYWQYADDDNHLSNVVDALVGTDGKLYYENIYDVQRGLPGPDTLPVSASTNFTDNSMASVTSYNQYGNPYNILNPSANYTMEFWFKTGESRRRVLVSCVEETHEWEGLTIWINSNGDNYHDGRVEVYESLTQSIISLENHPDTNVRLDWSDNNWHHLAVKRTSTTIYLYIDGEIQAQGNFNRVAARDPLQLHVGGAGPGSMNSNLNICEMAIYTYAMQEMQIVNRYLFTTRYKMSGYTLLQGNPVSAEVRFYNHYSGELVHTLKSNVTSGLYTYWPETNRLLDVVSYIPYNRTTRYRIHGPVLPAQYDDSHLG